MSLNMQIRPLTPELQVIAIKELNELPHRLTEDIAILRDWVLKQPHLRCCIDVQFLLSFLRGTKFSLEKAKHKLDRFYTLQAAIPEVFNEHRLVDDPMVLDIIQQGIILRIPLSPNDTGPCITIIRAGIYNTNQYKFEDIIRVGSMFGEIMMFEDDNATVTGYLELMDMTGVTGQHLFALQPDLLRKFALYADEAMPIRQKGIHFIRVPNAFETGFNTLRSFFPAKIKNRISVTSNPDAIFEYAPREYLPVEYGGTNGTIKHITERMLEKLWSYRKYFIESRNYGTDEKLRIKFHYRSSFGVDGSFRQLNID